MTLRDKLDRAAYEYCADRRMKTMSDTSDKELHISLQIWRAEEKIAKGTSVREAFAHAAPIATRIAGETMPAASWRTCVQCARCRYNLA